MAELVRGLVDDNCCECWKDGCGMDAGFGACADCLEAVNPAMEYFADTIWCLGSPLAFPCIFFFSPEPENEDQPQGRGGGWRITMLEAPTSQPLICCFATLCPCAGQWMARYQALKGDLTKYKLWQGQHDGPQCCAARCPGAPITIEAGTYGEQDCPHCFLCLEVTCLAGCNSICCSHNVTRNMVKREYNLGEDDTEIRQRKCVGFFSEIMQQCFCIACCMQVCSCCIGCCAIDSEGGQECSENGRRASSACYQIAWTLWRGIQSVRLIAAGCMVAQQKKELDEAPSTTPTSQKMQR